MEKNQTVPEKLNQVKHVRILTTPDCSRQIRILSESITQCEEQTTFLSERKDAGHWNHLSPEIRGLLEERLEMFKEIAESNKKKLDKLQEYLLKTAEVWEGDVELPEDWQLSGGWKKSQYLGG